jgi:regulator of protease activity HflC (stomatin/prohibitin superfamily)
MMAEADAYYAKTVAEAQKEVAPLVAQAVTAEGDAEKKLQKAFAHKREHEEIMASVTAVESFA